MANARFFESADWGPAAEAEFFKRLKRCTAHYQPQYACHKATVLTGTRDPVRVRAAIELLSWVRREFPDFWMMGSLHTYVGTARLVLGDLDAAIESYQEALREETKDPNIISDAWRQYTGLVVSRNLKHLFDEVLALLNEREKARQIWIPMDVFLMHGARALMAFDRGEWAAAWTSATAAAAEAAKETSGMAKHPFLGLVDADSPLLARVGRVLQDPRVAAAGRKLPPESSRESKAPDDPVEALAWKLKVQLSECGIKYKDLGDLWDKGHEYYEAGLPTMVRFLGSLPATEATWKLRSTLLFLLDHPGLRKHREAADVLMRVFDEPDSALKWRAGMAIARVARKEHAAWLVEALRDPKHGHGRNPLLVLLKTLLPDRAEELLLRMLKDEPEHPIWKLKELGYCGTARSLPVIRRYLKRDSDIRRCAKTAIAKIQARNS